MMEKMTIENMELYTVSECAELLKCSGKTIQRLIEKKKLQAFDIGAGERKIYRIPAEELERFLSAGSVRCVDTGEGVVEQTHRVQPSPAVSNFLKKTANSK